MNVSEILPKGGIPILFSDTAVLLREIQVSCVYSMWEARYTTLAPLANVIIISQFHGLSGATISFLKP